MSSSHYDYYNQHIFLSRYNLHSAIEDIFILAKLAIIFTSSTILT